MPCHICETVLVQFGKPLRPHRHTKRKSHLIAEIIAIKCVIIFRFFKQMNALPTFAWLHNSSGSDLKMIIRKKINITKSNWYVVCGQLTSICIPEFQKCKNILKICFFFSDILQNILQWVQMMAMTGKRTDPTQSPELRKAPGMANIPVPMLPFSKWSIVSKFLDFHMNSFKLYIYFFYLER